MSYAIEKGKRVVVIPTNGDKRFSLSSQLLVFTAASCDNNVFPKEYDWHILAVDTFSDWGGEIQLPAHLWEYAHCADGGGIKPHGRETTGIAYIQSWKKAVRDRFSAFNTRGETVWHPRYALWGAIPENVQDLQRINDPDAFSPRYKHLREPLYQAFRNLFPDRIERNNVWGIVYHTPNLLDALFLYQHREHLPFNFYLSDDENCRFLRNGESVQPELAVA
jgi:hypothetical protein